MRPVGQTVSSAGPTAAPPASPAPPVLCPAVPRQAPLLTFSFLMRCTRAASGRRHAPSPSPIRGLPFPPPSPPHLPLTRRTWRGAASMHPAPVRHAKDFQSTCEAGRGSARRGGVEWGAGQTYTLPSTPHVSWVHHGIIGGLIVKLANPSSDCDSRSVSYNASLFSSAHFIACPYIPVSLHFLSLAFRACQGPIESVFGQSR